MLTALLLVAVGLVGLALVRMPALLPSRAGRLFLLAALLVVPLVMGGASAGTSLQASKQRSFCTSCHEMEVYDTSLHINDSEYLPAVHVQNHYVPEDTACYTCHTDYTMYGDVKAKLNGLRHVFKHYSGDIPAAGHIKLYAPYPNDNCLQCHKGARRFEKRPAHNSDGVTLEELYANRRSCVSAGCHDKIHAIPTLGTADLWGKPRFPVPPSLLEQAPPAAAEDPFADEAPGHPPAAQDPFADEASPAPAQDPFANEAPDAGGAP